MSTSAHPQIRSPLFTIYLRLVGAATQAEERSVPSGKYAVDAVVLGSELARHNHCATVDAVINRSTRR